MTNIRVKLGSAFGHKRPFDELEAGVEFLTDFGTDDGIGLANAVLTRRYVLPATKIRGRLSQFIYGTGH